ncbi:hypothetical protein CEXT_6991 [Caerostris extrusa]|uniref:Uncharacterized protein n=1 Tax=Caerostris extrusa TaxID=172846 RepID=A0AAV4N9Z5_CAEEX|nr:hypothetical protein CEXT_6991 [Caerostris extrusa]
MAFSLATSVLAVLVALAHSRTFNDIVKMDRMMVDPDEELSPRVIGGRDALERENSLGWLHSTIKDDLSVVLS